jgi:prepilin-type processing-associated H-X9-DG protein
VGTALVRPSSLWWYGTSYYPNHLLIGQNRVAVPISDPCETAMRLWTRVNQRIKTLTRSAVKDPSRLILIGDFTWLDNWDTSDPSVLDDFPFWHQVRSMHNLAFMDGHVQSTRIRKGIHADAQYTLIPFSGLRREIEACGCQTEIK